MVTPDLVSSSRNSRASAAKRRCCLACRIRSGKPWASMSRSSWAKWAPTPAMIDSSAICTSSLLPVESMAKKASMASLRARCSRSMGVKPVSW